MINDTINTQALSESFGRSFITIKRNPPALFFLPKFKYTISKEYTILFNGDNLFVNQTFLYTVY